MDLDVTPCLLWLHQAFSSLGGSLLLKSINLKLPQMQKTAEIPGPQN